MRAAGGQSINAVYLLAARTDTVAHDCRSDAEIAVLQTVDTTDCMAYCRADQSADVVTDSASIKRVFSTAGRVLEKRR